MSVTNVRCTKQNVFMIPVDDFQDHELFRGCRLVKELDVSYNSLRRIPIAGFKILTKLEKLYMSYNQMTDPVFGPEFIYLEVW